MFHTDFFGGEADSLDAFITFGQNDYQSYSPQRSYFSYAENFASSTDKASLTDFLEAYREIFYLKCLITIGSNKRQMPLS